MIDCDSPRYHLNVSEKKSETLSNRSRARTSPDDENDNAIHSTPDIKVRTWLHSFPDKPSADDWKDEIQSIEDRVKPMNSISDDSGKSDDTGEVVDRGRIDASRKSSQDRKRSTNRPERVDEDGTLSQVNKGARQIEVIEIDSATSGLKYNASHARVRAKENREKNARSMSDVGETVNQSNSSTTTYDKAHQIAASAPSSLSMTNTSAITEQSTANWSSVIACGKEMKRARKRKVKKLDVSTEKNKNLPRVLEDVELSPSSRYNSARIAASYNESEKEANVSDRLRKSNSQTELFAKDKSVDARKSSSTYPTLNTSYVMLEEGRQIRIINLNNDQVNKIIGLQDAVEDPRHSQNRHDEINVDYHDSLLSPQNRLTVLTPEKLNESKHEHEIIHDILQTSAANLGSSSCLLAERRTPESRETSNVPRTSSETASSQLQSPTPNKARLSLRRKLSENKSTDSPPLSQLPLVYRLSTGKHEQDIGDRRSVDSPVSKDSELFNRLKAVRRDLRFNIIEDQQRTNRNTVPNAYLKSIIEVEDNNGNVSEIIHQDEKHGRNFATESTLSKKSVSTKSRSVKNQEHGSVVKFMQLGALIRRPNVKYCFLGATKHEQSMRAEVQITPICNMQQSVSTSEIYVATSPNPWNDSQSSSNIIVENICFANNANSNQAVSRELPAASPICKAPAFSTPKKDIDSHLNQKKSSTIVCSSMNANQRSDRSSKNIAEKDAQSLHRTSRADKSTIHRTISRAHPGTSNSIKLLSPDKDSQLKFLEIDSPMSEHGELRRASSMKSAIKEDNFSEMESSRLASMMSKAGEPFIENSCKKRKRMRCANDRELFEDESNDRNDDSSDSTNSSSQSTIKFDRYNESEKVRSSRLDANKKRRLSSPDDQDVEVIPSVSKKQDAPRRKSEMMSNSDTESESATRVKLNRY